MRPRALGPLVVFGALLAGALAPPTEGCDSTSCALLTRGQKGVVPKGGWVVDFSLRYTDEGQPLAGSTPTTLAVRPLVDFADRKLQPFYHLELDGSDTILQTDAAYGVTSRLAVTASLALLGVHSYNHLHYAPPPDPNAPADPEHGHGGASPSGPTLLHLRTEGNGDAFVGFRYALVAAPAQRLLAGFSMKLPTGRSQIIDPHQGGYFDPSMQPGTGSFDASMAAQYWLRAAGLDWTASGSYLLARANGLGYKFGNEAIAGLGVGRDLGRFTATVQLKGHHLDRSEYLGQGVPSTGGSMLVLTPGVRMRSGQASLYTFLQFPVHREVNEYQLATRGSVLMGVSRSF